MARTNEFFKNAGLSFGQQIGRMASRHPEFRMRFSRKGVSWVGELQPSSVSEKYTVRIDYTLRGRPKVWVLEPPLHRSRGDQDIPHIFSDGSLCLHMPEDWSPLMFVADTIIPWLALWLFYYESWLATGVWLGGGHNRQ